MAQPRPFPLTVVGLASLGFALAWLVWLALDRLGVLLHMLGAAVGDPAAVGQLSKLHLAEPGPVYVTLLTLFLELLLAVILLASGIGMLGGRPWARWSALFYCVWVILLEACSTLAQAFYLTPATEPVKVIPILVNGVTILFAIGLWGMVFLPSVEAAWAGEAPQGGVS